jgi:hypothetical protein
MMQLKQSNRVLLVGLAFSLFGFALTAVPSAGASPTPGGQINFFDASGTACSATAWNGGTFSDGNQGFGGNLGVDKIIPIVANG